MIFLVMLWSLCSFKISSLVLIHFFSVDIFSLSLFLCTSSFIIVYSILFFFFLFSFFLYWIDFPVGAFLVYSFMLLHLGF